MNRWLRRLRAIPDLLLAYSILRADAVAALRDPGIANALDHFRRDPAIAPLVSRISAEWRAVEGAVNKMR